MNEAHVKVYKQKIRAVIFGISATEEPILNIGAESMAMALLRVLFYY